MTNKNTLSLPIIIFLIFLVLKLAEIGVVASWSWWWVTCPLWIIPLVAISIGVIAFLIIIVALIFGMSLSEIIEKAEKYKKSKSKVKSK